MVVFGYYLWGGLLNLHIVLDDLHFTSIYNVEEDTSIINEPTGNTLRKITFTIQYQGLELMEQIASVLKKSFTFKRLGSEPIEFRASGSQNYGYTGGTLNDNTIISATITVQELDKDLPEEHSYQAQLIHTGIMNWLRTRAISSILIKKGLFTEEEYLHEIDELIDSDYENLRKLILYGLPEPEKK